MKRYAHVVLAVVYDSGNMSEHRLVLSSAWSAGVEVYVTDTKVETAHVSHNWEFSVLWHIIHSKDIDPRSHCRHRKDGSPDVKKRKKYQ